MGESSEPRRRSPLEARKPVEREQEFDKAPVACIPNLKRVAKQLTRDSYVADELLQTTLVKSMQDRDKFRDNLNDPETTNKMQMWTATILRNTYSSLGRHASKNLEDSRDAAQNAPEIAGNSVELGDALDQRRTAQKLMEIIGGCHDVREKQWSSLLMKIQRRAWRLKWVLAREQSSDIDSGGVRK